MHSISRNWTILALPLVLLAGQCLFVQVGVAGVTKPSNNSGTEIKLQASSTVGDCVTVEAGLLPREPAAKLFGGWVAENYAVVETTVSNHCDNQQFILHNIYLDYSDWALSGVYKGLTPATVCPYSTQTAVAAPPKPAQTEPSLKPAQADLSSMTATAVPSSTATAGSPVSPLGENCVYTQHTEAGQVPTIGARVVHDQLSEASVFSPRNLVVNGLILVGEVAGGYAFAGSAAAVQGIGAYNSAFIPGLQKFWPDRRPDQETNVLTYGYRTDQSTAIAKDDHGSYFAFFPISSFLIREDLKPLFLSDSAAFINPGEVLPDIRGNSSDGSAKPSKNKKARVYAGLRNYLLDLTAEADFVATGERLPVGEDARRAFSLRLQYELGMPCNLIKDSSGAWGDPGPQCPLDRNDPIQLAELKRISTEKYLFAHASLNIVKIVARGVMTVNLDSVPPTIDTVTFDGTPDEASYWTVPPSAKPAAAPAAVTGAAEPAAKPAAKPDAGAPAAAPAAATAPDEAKTSAPSKTLTGVIAGKYLTDGTLTITAITVPGDSNAKLTDYIVDKSLKAVSEKSTDTSMAFILQLAKTVPSGSKLTFQVSHSTGDATKGTSSQTTSNKYVYTVIYSATPADTTVKEVTMDGDDKTDVWQAARKLSGTATGTNLEGGTISVAALQIGGKSATAAEYIGPLAGVPSSSNETTIDFVLPLLQKIADGSTVSFVVNKKAGDTTVASSPFVYTVKNPAKPVKKAATPVKKAAPKPAKSATTVSK